MLDSLDMANWKRESNVPKSTSKIYSKSTYLIRSMVDNQVNHELHVALFQLSNEFINITQSAVAGINVLIVGLTNLSVSSGIYCSFRVKFTISKILKSV